MKTMGEIIEAKKHHGINCFINMWYKVSIFFSANVTVQARPTAEVYTFAARESDCIATTCGS